MSRNGGETLDGSRLQARRRAAALLVRPHARWYIRPSEAGSPSAGRLGHEMNTSRQIIAIVTAALGVLLIVKGAWDGVWPLSIQLIAGVLLLVLAGFRWWTLR